MRSVMARTEAACARPIRTVPLPGRTGSGVSAPARSGNAGIARAAEKTPAARMPRRDGSMSAFPGSTSSRTVSASSSPGGGFSPASEYVTAAAAADGIPFVSPLTGGCYDAAGFLIATHGPFITSAITAYIGGDGVHPTDAGHVCLARRIVAAIQELMPHCTAPPLGLRAGRARFRASGLSSSRRWLPAASRGCPAQGARLPASAPSRS